MAPRLVERIARTLGREKKKGPKDRSQAKATGVDKLQVEISSPPSQTTKILLYEPSSLLTHTATQHQISPLDGDALMLQASTIKEDLWNLAYERLKNDDKKSQLINKYKGILLEDSTGNSASSPLAHDISGTEGRERQLSRVVQEKFQTVQEARWKFAIFSKEIEVREQFDRVVSAVTWAKDFITAASSSDPHAALAWAGVCVALPLLLNPSLQRDAAIKGLDTVSNLICQSKVIDEIYFERKAEIKTQAFQALTNEFRDKRIRLYSHILEFEAQLVCYFSTNKVERTIRDMIKYDSWDGLVENIHKMGELGESDRQIIDAERMHAGFERFDGISKSIEAELFRSRRRWEDRDRQDILVWLSHIDSRTRQIDTLSRRQEGTGQWLFEEPAFQCCLQGAERRLWCFGIPGAGKTILASTVIDYLERRFYKDKVAIAFLYCNYKERDTQTPQNLIGSLVQQLVQRNLDVPDDLRAFYKAHVRSQHKSPTPPTLTECVQLLKSQLAGYQSVFLVIDALDELDEGTRSKLCDQLERLPQNTHLMITSRDIPELKDQIKSSISLEIRADSKDIEKYLEDQIERKSRLKQHIQADPGLGPLLINTIRDKAKGMFLLAQLHLESLANNYTPNEVRKSLQQLPTPLNAIYDNVMDRISRNEKDTSLGRKVLTWISYARRPLTVAEMQYAIKIEPNSRGLSKGDLIPTDTLISVCAGIVTVDEKSNIIRLVHYTAQEYFLEKRSTFFQDAERALSNACLTYLLFDNFRDGCCKTMEALGSLLEENPLLDYAARHWADHAREVKGPDMGVILNFLEDVSRTSLSFQVIGFRKYTVGNILSTRMSGLHLCAYFGLHVVIIRMLETQSNVDIKDHRGQTPLSWAIQMRHQAVAKLIIEKGADVNSKDRNGNALLWWAIFKEQKVVAKLLIEKGADVNSKKRNGYTLLRWAFHKEQEAVAKLLIEKGADVNLKASDGSTPLYWAISRGQEAIVKLLIEKGAEINLKDNDDVTPLYWAISKRQEAISKLLIEKGADVNSKASDGKTLLWRAISENQEAIAKLLVEKGAILR